MSASVKVGQKLRRKADRKTAGGTPIACKTGEGNNEPLEQADPVEQATPAKSSASSSRSPRQPGNDTFNVQGELAGEPSGGP